MPLKSIIRSEAEKLGFSLCGFAPLQTPPHGEFVRSWLREGHAGTMSYLGRGLDKRVAPSLVAPGARSVIVVGFPYRAAIPPPADWRAELRGRVAAYALGPDYHTVMHHRLHELATRLAAHGITVLRTYVDTGPVLEREWANLGGLGWFGKNTMILNRHQGSWFFLGEVFIDRRLDPEPTQADHCGTCRRCLELCPVAALQDGYVMDARVCISYLTIEYRGVIPRQLRAGIGEWIFGCDVCQEVCPWNERHDGCPGARQPGMQDIFPYLPELLALDAEAYRGCYGGTAVSRAKRDCFVRNVAVVLGNTRNPAAVSCLARALQKDPSALVRAHVAWALEQIDDRTAQRALQRAWEREENDAVRQEIEMSLAIRTGY